MAKGGITLSGLSRWSDASALLMRLVVGGFLIWGVWDNITSDAHMAEFVRFLAKWKFPFPEIMAPLSVWTQFACGAAFVAGALTRWAGLLCAVHFLIAIAMVDRFAGIRGSFPAAALVVIGLHLATAGPGRFAVDALFGGRRR
ncbi:DoxX family protein [Phenylobacterium terrae]|uniref:DoxX family protein n=1 Tax=Phenylobacterium terrae TaxID=2665495 RepID=A0ABW4N2S8_9CAUL